MKQRMGFWELSKRIADLVLISDGDVEWTKAPEVRRSWHFLLLLIVANFVGKNILQQIEPPPTTIISGYLVDMMILMLSAWRTYCTNIIFAFFCRGKTFSLNQLSSLC